MKARALLEYRIDNHYIEIWHPSDEGGDYHVLELGRCTPVHEPVIMYKLDDLPYGVALSMITLAGLITNTFNRELVDEETFRGKIKESFTKHMQGVYRDAVRTEVIKQSKTSFGTIMSQEADPAEALAKLLSSVGDIPSGDNFEEYWMEHYSEIAQAEEAPKQ